LAFLNIIALGKNWRMNMKKIALAAVFAGTASTAFAGGMDEPVVEMEPVVVEEETTAGSSSNLIVPLILVALIAAAASAD
jgi:hypothetical protein